MIELLRQALHALELEPTGQRLPWNKAQSIVRSAARFELRVAIARAEAIAMADTLSAFDDALTVPQLETRLREAGTDPDALIAKFRATKPGLRVRGVVVG